MKPTSLWKRFNSKSDSCDVLCTRDHLASHTCVSGEKSPVGRQVARATVRTAAIVCLAMVATGLGIGSETFADEPTATTSSFTPPATATVPAPAQESGSPAPAVEDGGTLQTVFKPVMAPNTPANGFAQENVPKVLKVKIFPLYDRLPRGEKCFIAVELQVAFGWHINANPANPDFLVPTDLKLKSDQKIKLLKVKYPEAHALKMEGSDDPYHVYDGKVLLYGMLEIDAEETAEFGELEFHVTFQGCSEKDQQCLPPDLIVMKGKLPIAPAGTELKKINPEKWPKPVTDETPKSGTAPE